jgi:hypothetical protein
VETMPHYQAWHHSRPLQTPEFGVLNEIQYHPQETGCYPFCRRPPAVLDKEEQEEKTVIKLVAIILMSHRQ